MAPVVGVASKSSAGKHGGTSRHTLKKGPWTAAEDAILIEYVKKHGEGNWNAVQRNSGLMRCGKSCRLRWANHLRPNLKKGAFSSEEEALIVELHAKLGNKWARMAAQLPGRTDNEIKNYWNTRLKRRQRAGLPIYPHDVNVKAQSQYQQENSHQANPSSSSLAAALLSPPPPPVLNPGYSTPLSLFNIFNPSSTMKPRLQQPNTSYLPNPNQPFKFLKDYNGGRALSTSSSSPFSSSSGSSPFQNLELQNSLPLPTIQYNHLNFGSDSTPVSVVSFEQSGVVLGTGGAELPSIQSLVPKTAPTSSANNASDYMIATSRDADDHENNQGFPRGNSGLLEDLIDESQALICAKKSRGTFPVEDKSEENYLWDYKVMESLNFSQDNVTQEKRIEDSSPVHSSIRPKTMHDSSEETNPVDDDFLSLLDNFPLTAQIPDWYDRNGNIPNGQLSNSVAGETGKKNRQESSNSLAGATSMSPDRDFDIGSCCWKNMPGIYQM